MKTASSKVQEELPGFWSNFSEYFQEYTSTTSLHAIQYLGEYRRTIFERILWFLLIVGSLSMCNILIYKAYYKWDNTPMIVTFTHSPTPIWQIPFPAVTICPETKFKPDIFNFTNEFLRLYRDRNMTDEEKENLHTATLLCDSSVTDASGALFSDDVLRFLKRVAPTNEDTIIICQRTNLVNTDCGRLFTTILTDEGICFTFNMLDRSEIFRDEVYHTIDLLKSEQNSSWDVDRGYHTDEYVNVYPKRTLFSGAKSGLIVFLAAEAGQFDYNCKYSGQGFKVILHSPGEIPRPSMQYIRVSLNEEVTIVIKPEMLKTSTTLKDYPPRKRGCYFSFERYLRFYKVYTQQNCQMECITNITLAMCDCVAFYMPRDNRTQICSGDYFQCLQFAEFKLVPGLVDNEGRYSHVVDDCDCLPSCTSLTYSTEISQTSHHYPGYHPKLSKQNISRINIFFKELQFLHSERSELYGLTDFLANCGGLLGLFTGFSVLSLMEIIYFLTLRLWINLKRNGRHYWSVSEALPKNEIPEDANRIEKF